jgi:hypothetical protein
LRHPAPRRASRPAPGGRCVSEFEFLHLDATGRPKSHAFTCRTIVGAIRSRRRQQRRERRLQAEAVCNFVMLPLMWLSVGGPRVSGQPPPKPSKCMARSVLSRCRAACRQPVWKCSGRLEGLEDNFKYGLVGRVESKIFDVSAQRNQKLEPARLRWSEYTSEGYACASP